MLTRVGGEDYVGETFTVERVGPFNKGYPWGDGMCARLDCDYRIKHADGQTGAVKDFQLRKINPPAEPDSIVRRQECEAGMDRAIEHAERVDDSWPVVAYNFLCRYAHTHEYFDAWEVTAEAQRLGYGAPTTDKAWGSIFVKAVRNEIIEAWGVGRNPNRHASICIRYRSNVYVGSVA